MDKRSDTHIGFEGPLGLKQRVQAAAADADKSMAKTMIRFTELGLTLYKHYGERMLSPNWKLPNGAFSKGKVSAP
jgi:hypothetical protein